MINSLFSLWLIREINFLIFLLILKQKTKFFKSELILYFFIQALSRILLIYFLLFRKFFLFKNLILIIILSIKIGLIPFHIWYINIINLVSWNLIWLLTIWIKILYFKIIEIVSNNFIFLITLINVLIRRITLLKEKTIKRFLGLSSIFNIGWLLSSLTLKIIWLLFFFLYGLNLLLLFRIFKETNFFLLSHFNFSHSFHIKILLLILILFVVGTPPFPGFLTKLLIVSVTIKFSIRLSFILIISTLIFIYTYIILLFYFLLQSEISLIQKQNKSFSWAKLFFLNIAFIPIFLIFLFYYLNNKITPPALKLIKYTFTF